MVHKTKPKNFNKDLDIVSCFIQHKNQILIVHRQDHKPQGNTWSIPAGKVEKNETLLEALTREIHEEVGILLNHNQVNYFDRTFIIYPKFHFEYHMYVTKLNKKLQIKLNKEEHKDYKWITPQEALNHNLIPGEKECIQLYILNYLQYKTMPKHI